MKGNNSLFTHNNINDIKLFISFINYKLKENENVNVMIKVTTRNIHLNICSDGN